MSFVLREWQRLALDRCRELTKSIVEACPGSGKSAFSGGLAKHWLDSGDCNHVLAVVPSISIKRGVMRQWANNWGLRVRGNLVKRSGNALRLPATYDATVVTYHELRNEQCEDILRLWVANKWNFGAVFDEIHHAARNQSWGEAVRLIGHDLASRVCIMTGTPFRSDGQPIELMEYVTRDGGKVAEPDYRHVYRQAVEDDICRPVTCRWIEANLTFSHKKRGIYAKESSEIDGYEMAEAMRMFFNPSGEVMKNLVKLVHSDLMRLRENAAYKNAAALFVCRPAAGGGEEDSGKHVTEMGKLIERITGEEVVIVSHDRDDSADRIDEFASSNAPYLVAVNMVSEGVDIPRLRKVAFCRNTESEMLFRQIVGRVIRKTIDRDPVASEVYVPAFRKMMEFGQRLWDEAKAGLKGREVLSLAGTEPRREFEYPENPKLVGIDAIGGAGGGQFDSTSVEINWIGLAEKVVKKHTSFRHWGTTHLGAFLKQAHEFSDLGVADASPSQQRDNLVDMLRRRLMTLAKIAHNSEYGVAWRVELFDKFNVNSLDDIRALWTDDKIMRAIVELEKKIDSTAHNREES